MRYAFGECTLDADQYVLYQGECPIPLQRKVFQVLHYLLTHRDRVIAKQELAEQVWPDLFISDATLEGVIKAVRRAVGDDGRTQWCIQTRRGQGYRFVAPLAESDAAEPDAAVSVAPPIVPADEVATTSRRQLTVMLCDLVESPPLAAQLDPEDLREVVLAYHAACSEVVQRFEGHIAQYLGDGLMIFFSYPQAHEDDAQRAVRTGLGILEAIGSLNTRLQHDHGVRLAVRLGIHTGLVVVSGVGEHGRQHLVAFGETPHIASRLQNVARANQVVLSEHTQRLAGGVFDYEDLGVHTLQGVPTPMQILGVRGVRGALSRFEAATVTGLTPLVGREEELHLILHRWELAKTGEGPVVLLTGEAGIGKSRLTQAVRERIAAEPHTRVLSQCSPYYRNSAFYPFIVQFERAAQFARDDTPLGKLAKLEALLAQSDLVVNEIVPLVAALLSIPTGDRYPALTLTPEQQRARTIEALVGYVIGLAHHHPVLMLLEDAHWSDPTTREVLEAIVYGVRTARVLLVITSRSVFDAPWKAATHVTEFTLNRLSQSQSAAMVEQLSAGKKLSAVVRDAIIVEADGIPLFVEEVTKTMMETGPRHEHDNSYTLTGSPRLTVPSTLQDLLMARLDQLGPVKEVAQMGATLGREFAYEQLAAVATWHDAALRDALQQLVQMGVLFRSGQPPEAHYRFKHALIQAAAYQSLLKSTRQQYHAQIARVLVERFSETVETVPELLAHHYTEAGLFAQAIPYWQCAGETAIQRLAHVEAIAHLTRGLELLQHLPADTTAMQRELALRVILGRPLVATRGFGSRQVEHTYRRARELSRQVGKTPQLLQVLWDMWGEEARKAPQLFKAPFNMWTFYFLQAEFQVARELGEQLLPLAQRMEDAACLAEAHQALGLTLFALGDFLPAQTQLQQGLAHYDSQQHRFNTNFRFNQDAGVYSLSYDAKVLWLLGYPDQAMRRSEEAQALAQHLSHPFSQAAAFMHACWPPQFRRESAVVQEYAQATIAFCEQHRWGYFLNAAIILHGWALAEQGRFEEGIAQIHRGLATPRTGKPGDRLFRPYFLALLAQAYGTAGQTESGLNVLAEALQAVDKTGERFYEAELYRLQGALLLSRSSDHRTQAETCFHHALDVARRQQAKSWELRATMSLSRLWQHQGKCEEARQLLAAVYDWFTEGFATPDLQDAQALLEELAHVGFIQRIVC